MANKFVLKAQEVEAEARIRTLEHQKFETNDLKELEQINREISEVEKLLSKVRKELYVDGQRAQVPALDRGLEYGDFEA